VLNIPQWNFHSKFCYDSQSWFGMMTKKKNSYQYRKSNPTRFTPSQLLQCLSYRCTLHIRKANTLTVWVDILMICPGCHITSEKCVIPPPPSLIAHMCVKVCHRYLSIRSSDDLSMREISLRMSLLPAFSGRSQLYYFKVFCFCVLQYCKHLCKSQCLRLKKSYIDVLSVVV
jgi:hypothetical protein